MRSMTLVYIGIGTFLACWVLLFALPCFVSDCGVGELTRLAEGMEANFVLLAVLFSVVGMAAALAADILYRGLRRFRLFQPKLGEILVRRGYVSRRQLENALALQKMRIGELLRHFGYLSDEQLAEALRRQRKERRKRLGQVISEMGFASDRQVQWAAERVHRKLGAILIDMGLIGRDELRTVLGRLWYGRRKGL